MNMRRMFFTMAHAAAVGVLVHLEAWGLAAFTFCLFINASLSK